MHQDHGTSPAVCQRSIQLGFTSVMMDGSLEETAKHPNYDSIAVRGKLSRSLMLVVFR